MAVFFLKHGAVPSLGKAASDYAVGESVFLIEDGNPVEYLVVNQGNPDTSLYDASCDGTWVLRKETYGYESWNYNGYNTYANSAINGYLNSTFYKVLGISTQTAIKLVKIPYCVGGGNLTIQYGVNGLSARVFLLGGYEVNWTDVSTYFPEDGAVLSYFQGTGTSDSKRIAYFNGNDVIWWLRSPHTYDIYNPINVLAVGQSGFYETQPVNYSRYIRPALIIEPTTKFDPNTNIIL